MIKTENDKPYRIATFDGGGMCGIISLRFVELLGLNLQDCTLLAGTSTGGITSVAAAAGLSISDIKAFYYEMGPSIFSRSVWRRIRDPFAIFRPMYNSDNLAKSVKKALPMEGKIPLSSLSPKVMVPSYNYKTGEPKFFKSWRSEDSGFTAFQVSMATSAAPVYFSMFEDYADGGLVANNPTMCAIVECLKIGIPMDQLEVYSFGTGNSQVRTGSNQKSGALGWAPELIGVLISGPVKAVHHQAKMLPLKLYKRFDVPRLPYELGRMADARSSVLRAREAEADKYFNSESKDCPWIEKTE